jgi:hypothetical protein
VSASTRSRTFTNLRESVFWPYVSAINAVGDGRPGDPGPPIRVGTTTTTTAATTSTTNPPATPTTTSTPPAPVPQPVPTAGTQQTQQSPAVPGGYRMLQRAGFVHGFGAATLGTTVGPSAAIAPGVGQGYWVLAESGRVIAMEGARHHGNVDTALLAAGEQVATIAGLPDGSGYWVFTNRGRVIPFGAARSYGDMTGTRLNGAIVASVPTVTGLGYWVIGSDGGVFSFGDAKFYGSMGGRTINQPVVGIAPDPDGVGYWLVAADGGIFAFDATFRGSVPGALAAGQRLNRPVIGAVAYGAGYLMVASDGGVFDFSGQRAFYGSLGSNPPATPIVGVAPMR